MEELVQKFHKMFSASQATMLEKALEMAQVCHADQLRESGEPYIVHPVQVAHILLDMHMDAESVAAGLLHDVIEDTDITKEILEKKISKTVANLVQSVSKLDKLSFVTREERQAETLRKMLLAMAQDVRVVLIKLADRLHNMRTLQYCDLPKQRQISKETLEIYAPLAHRLGIFKMRSELEDLCLRYLEPEAYAKLQDQIRQYLTENESWMDDIKKALEELTKQLGITDFEIESRTKHLYSIWRKMTQQHRELEQIYDLFAFRVIVPEIKDCYAVLGSVHHLWRPLPGRFKDYIAVSKANKYQSLHTTVIGRSGVPFEIQIRTFEMHQTAEFGIAAHWIYKEGRSSSTSLDERISWVRRFMEDQSDLKDAMDFVDTLKVDLFEDEVFVFTPKGDVINLPKGATPIDFAYAIHSQVGNRCIGAKANGRIVPLDSALKSGEIIEVITGSVNKGPSRDWLNIVVTSSAKSKIRAWFKREEKDENIAKGKDMLENASRRMGFSMAKLFQDEYVEHLLRKYTMTDAEDIFAAVGYGGLTTNQVLLRLIEEYKKDSKNKKEEAAPIVPVVHKNVSTSTMGVRVKGEGNLLVRFANCCNPVPGDEIIGYVTRGRGVSVHRLDCSNLHDHGFEIERLVDVEWESNAVNVQFKAEIQILALDRPRLLADITTILSDMRVTMLAINAHVSRMGQAVVNVMIEISGTSQLDAILRRMMRIQGVQDVHRMGKG